MFIRTKGDLNDLGKKYSTTFLVFNLKKKGWTENFQETPSWRTDVSHLLKKNFGHLFPGLPCFLGPFPYGTSTYSQTRPFLEQVLTSTDMTPLFRTTRGRISESPSWSLLKRSTAFPLLLRALGHTTVTSGSCPFPLMVKVRIWGFILPRLEERHRNNFSWH